MGSGGSGAAPEGIYPPDAGWLRPSEFEGRSRSAPVFLFRLSPVSLLSLSRASFFLHVAGRRCQRGARGGGSHPHLAPTTALAPGRNSRRRGRGGGACPSRRRGARPLLPDPERAELAQAGGGVRLGRRRGVRPLLPDPGRPRGSPRPVAGLAQAGGAGDRILLLKIQCGMSRKKMHDMWDPLTSTLYDMRDPLTVLKLPSIPYFVPPTKQKKGRSHSNPTFATKHEKGWSRPQNEGRLHSAPAALQPNTRCIRLRAGARIKVQAYWGWFLPATNVTILVPCINQPRY
jgi:hypothetical protein